MLTTKDPKSCQICKVQPSKYTCPKCDLPYCSLACYQTHNQRCTESFYKENVLETMSSLKPTDDQKLEVMQILQRVQQKDELEQEEEAFLERLERFDLEDPDLFHKLSKEEQETFLQLISQQQVSSLIELWRPWWLHAAPVAKIEVLFSEGQEPQNEFLEEGMPLLIKSIPPFNSCTSKPPSPYLLYNLINLLYAYTFVMRTYNGDYSTDLIECVLTLHQVSSVFDGEVHVTTQLALNAAQQGIRKPTVASHPNPVEFSISCIDDTAEILKSKVFVLRALSDIFTMHSSATSKTKRTKGSNLKKALALAEKKVLFYLAWANEVPDDGFDFVLKEVQSVFQEQTLNSTKKLTPVDPKLIIKI